MSPTFADLEGRTYGDIAAAGKTLEQRVSELEEAMHQIYPHAHCHPDHCPCKVKPDDKNGQH